MNKCKYGCNQPGIKQFKDGSWCCSSNVAKCPEIKKKTTGDLNPAKRPEVRKKISKGTSGENNGMYGMTGELNPSWNGGGSRYWKEILLSTQDCCNLCKSKKQLEIHHIDHKYKNNNLDNIIILCQECHGFYHVDDRAEGRRLQVERDKQCR